MDAHATTTKKPGRRFLGCLVRGPLGCLAFLAGAFVVTIVFFPLACSPTVGNMFEESFNERFDGTLRVGDAWLLALYGTQSIEDVSLYDPEGDEVARGELHAPDVIELAQRGLNLGDADEDGPVRLVVSNVNIVQEDDRSTNFARAFAREPDVAADGESVRPPRVDWSNFVPGQSFGADSGPSMEVRVERLTWSNALTRERDAKLELRDLGGHALLTGVANVTVFQLDVAGTFPGESGGRLELTYTVQGLEFLEDEHKPVSNLLVRFEEVAAADLEVLTLLDGFFESAFGARIDELRLLMVRTGMDQSSVELDIRSAAASLSLKGLLLEDEHLLLSGADGAIRVTFEPGSWWSETLLGRLLPAISEVRAREDGGQASLEITSFTLPLRADYSRFSARLRFDLGAVTYELSDAFRSLPGSDLLGRLATDESKLEISVDEGLVDYTEVGVQAGDGIIELSGSYGLEGRRFDDLYVSFSAEALRGTKARLFVLNGSPDEPDVTDLTDR